MSITDPGERSSTEVTNHQLTARLDRLNNWPLPYLHLGIIGIGFLFTFFDIFDINVSFIQTCSVLKPGCTPETALSSLPLPVLLNLAGYVVGTLILSPISDRIGRRNMLFITMFITGLGSLYTAFAPDYTNFIIARIVTGIGIGADLSVVNTYIGEIAPSKYRARFTSMIFIMSALGAFFGIWLGLLLTTPAAPWPTGLPFAMAGKNFADGWRYLYGIGALLALVGLLLRTELPESPRWLVGQNRLTQADSITSKLEGYAARRAGGPLPEPDLNAPVEKPSDTRNPYSVIFTSALYRKRFFILVATWFIGYITVYSYASGFTSVLTSLHYPPPEAGVIVSVGVLGFIAGGIITSFLGDSLERKYWLPLSAILTLIGAAFVAEAGKNIDLSFVGAAIVFLGFNMWVSPTYALSAESFPSRSRTTGFGLVDGVGHIGGGIGVLLIAPFIPKLSALAALMLISGFLVVAAIIVQAAPSTRGEQLEEVSP